MPKPVNSFKKLAGVPVHYDRFPDERFGYGTRGKPLTWHCTEDFEKTLNDAFEELWEVCPRGKAEVITTAGAYVNKPGRHGQGRAFDLDGIFWEDRSFVTLNYPKYKAFYLGVEAVLRKHFGTVLNYNYNVDHQDHLHVDDGTEPGFVARHESRVLFLQTALTYLYDHAVTIDGLVGPETNGAASELLLRLGLAEEDEVSDDSTLHRTLDRVWTSLLDRSAREGFKRAHAIEEEETPLDLVREIYTVIERELQGHPSRKDLETAVTSFVNHPDTDSWLDQFRQDS